jgi:hypothetical protein
MAYLKPNYSWDILLVTIKAVHLLAQMCFLLTGRENHASSLVPLAAVVHRPWVQTLRGV